MLYKYTSTNTEADDTEERDVPQSPDLENAGSEDAVGADGGVGWEEDKEIREIHPRVLVKHSRIGGSEFESWPPEEAGVEEEVERSRPGGGVDEECEDDEDEARGLQGACISGVHVCGHGFFALQHTRVAACMHAGVVATQHARAAISARLSSICLLY